MPPSRHDDHYDHLGRRLEEKAEQEEMAEQEERYRQLLTHHQARKEQLRWLDEQPYMHSYRKQPSCQPLLPLHPFHEGLT